MTAAWSSFLRPVEVVVVRATVIVVVAKTVLIVCCLLSPVQRWFVGRVTAVSWQMGTFLRKGDVVAD
jgi:hypothetical protein